MLFLGLIDNQITFGSNIVLYDFTSLDSQGRLLYVAEGAINSTIFSIRFDSTGKHHFILFFLIFLNIIFDNFVVIVVIVVINGY